MSEELHYVRNGGDRVWTEKDDFRLYALFCDKKTVAMMSRLMSRAKPQVKERLQILGLHDSRGRKVSPTPSFAKTQQSKSRNAKLSKKNSSGPVFEKVRDLDFKLTEEQKEALEKMQHFVERSRETFFLLEGFAGTGKSTLCCQLIHLLANKKFALTAPTNKAVRVLRSMRRRRRLNVYCSTIHSLLKLVPKHKEGETFLEMSDEASLKKYDVIIIDECSMINEELMSKIIEVSDYNFCKVIFMGDPAQLPPVKEHHSPSFDVKEKVRLSKIVRQTDLNPILPLSEMIRQYIDSKDYPFPPMMTNHEEDRGVICAKSLDQWLHWIRHYFSQKDFDRNNDSFRVVTWTNARVAEINAMVRREIYGETETPFIKGERVIATMPILGEENPQTGTREILIKTDDECLVVSIEEDELDSIPVWRVLLQNEDGDTGMAVIYQRKAEQEYQTRVKTLKDQALKDKKLWFLYYQFMEQFHTIQSVYCMTVHRSQGSTFKHVFVDTPNILCNPNVVESYKMLYVAVTRSTHSVMVY